ncbi:MAG: cytidine deaminase [Clostridia bacterium]|nr:cytidine deaminase [Clostridia bacterium]
MTNFELLNIAKDAMQKSYSPYSSFKVGAALLCNNGKVFSGCNIENSSYSPSNCAERTAFFKAISEGNKDFEKIAIVGGQNGVVKGFCPPCGVCLQVMSEFCNDEFKIILTNENNEVTEKNLCELLPFSFSL